MAWGMGKSDNAKADALAACQRELRRFPKKARLAVLRGLFAWVSSEADDFNRTTDGDAEL